MRTLRHVGIAATICVLLTGCASGGSTQQTSTTTAAPTTTPSSTPVTTATTLPPAFTGSLDAFYIPPKPLPAAQPGTLIRYQVVGHTADDTTWRIMYHSVDAAGRDQAVPAMISFPNAPAPQGGWPVVSTAPGTVGMHDKCALSRSDDPPDDYGIEGVSVRTDYIGMVAGQTQRYLSGVSEAHSVIDAVRAARNIPAAHAGKRWVAFGHSQGGHSALFTNQLARTWAPELDLLGTVVGAPAAELTRTFGPKDELVPQIVSLMGLFGIAADHPGTDPEALLTKAAKDKLDILENGCLDQISIGFAELAVKKQIFAKDLVTTEPSATLIRENDPGQVKSPSPIYLFTGDKDWRVVPARVEALRKRLCALGQVTEYTMLPGANHGTEIAVDQKGIHDWIAARFAGKPAPDNCPTS